MEYVSGILQAISTLAWPIIVILVIVLFYSNVKELIESAKSRGFTVKVAGNELTMEEVSEQQRNLIVDLQEQLIELQKQVNVLNDSIPTDNKASEEAEEVKEETNTLSPSNILWVDDKPRNNAYLVQNFRDRGIGVTLALSTEEGLQKFSKVKYDRVITDMGRMEASNFNPQAGLELVRRIRRIDQDVPIFIYTSSRSIREHGVEATGLGAAITSSPTVLLEKLQL